MERVEAINPDRLKWCSEQYGIALDDLARQLRIAPETMEKAVNGEPALTFNQLEKIAKCFNRGILFFLEEAPVSEEQVFSPQFRTLSSQKTELTPNLKNIIQRFEKQREGYIGLLEDLDEPIDRPWLPEGMPDTGRGNIKETAAFIRSWLGIGSRTSFEELRSAVESKGILVFVSNGYQGQWKIAKENPVRGFSMYYDHYPVIVIKKLDARAAQTFTMIHELGHLLLHRETMLDEADDFYSHQGKEREANAFAGNLLVPDAFVHTINMRDFPYDTVSGYDNYLKSHARQWGVSVEVVLRRLMDEGRLASEHYEAYRQWRAEQPAQEAGGAMRYRYQEPTNMFGDTFVRTVLDAYHSDHITLARASSYLDNLKVDYIHELEARYARL
jgi:Zn-dependent peptidase ImmA (M78 family)